MGHDEIPDTASDFKGLTLPGVTLVCIDDNPGRAAFSINECMKYASFGSIKMITEGVGQSITHSQTKMQIIGIDRLGSKEAYSHFIIHELYKYVETSHVLIVQHDGYVKNWQAWQKDWLQYDYIGAPWGIEYAPYRVGNGGFSLRSQKLCRITAGINPGISHPEDAVICRELRPLLEAQHGIKFAPVEVAERFSFEGYNQYGTYTGQFGFHGERAFRIVSEPKFEPAPGVTHFKHNLPVRPAVREPQTLTGPPMYVNLGPQGIIFNQFLGLGDILFLVPLARHYMAKGHDIIWPVADEYQQDLKRHFPDIQFVRKSTFPMDYEARKPYMHRWQYGVYKVLPFRWNLCNTPDCSDCMTGKYTMVGEDWKMWRGLKWERSLNKEFEFSVELGCTNEDELNDFKEYELHAQSFGCEVSTNGKKTRATGNTGLPRIAVHSVKGYSLLDWSLIFENATIIHAVSSSTLYMLETLNLKAKEIHLYGRDNGLKDIEYIKRLLTKDYIFHP